MIGEVEVELAAVEEHREEDRGEVAEEVRGEAEVEQEEVPKL